MQIVGAFEAKTHLAQILTKLEHTHEHVIIQRHGRKIAVLVPYEEAAAASQSEQHQRILDGVRRIRARAKGGKSPDLKQLVAEGRRR